MAESVVTFFLKKLGELLQNEALLLQGVDEEMRSLHRELEWIRSFLKDADEKRKENERVKVWVTQIREVAYDAEDVIDDFILTVERKRRRSIGFMGLFVRYTGCLNQLSTLHDVGTRIKKINRRIEGISADKLKYGIESIQAGESSGSSNEGWQHRERREPVVEELDVVGIEDDAKKLVRRMIEGEAQRTVVSIIGMGGIGKTTLAKKVYSHSDVKRHFDCRAWVYVSQEFRVRELLLGIIKCVMTLAKEMEIMNEEALRKTLFRYLKGRRYLVVIDDIWRREAWDSLLDAFPNERTSSRVMLTTRNKDVALYADALSLPHELQLLDDEECWDLFCKKAFVRTDGTGCTPNLEKIGREIMAKCHGLPLAVVVLGGLLSRKEKSVKEWAKVLKSISWQLREGQDQISKILALSYNDLPYYLKSCFLHFGVFKEDSEIHASKLAQLWMAEGFIQERGEETMEDVAEDYLEELIHRSMIQVARKTTHGAVKTCRIHDLLRDLAISEAKEVKFLDVHADRDSRTPTLARRLVVFHHGSIAKYVALNCSIPYLRSLLFFPLNEEKLVREQWGSLHRGFKFLKVLILEGVFVSRLPDEIGHLIHLRYFRLKSDHFHGLPSTICNLYNLQTLDIRKTYVSHLPNDFWKLKQLRHLHLDKNSFCEIDKHARFDHFMNLQTLSTVWAGTWIEHGLGMLTNLRKLGISGGFSLHQNKLTNSIVKLEFLRSLRLQEMSGGQLPRLMSLSKHLHLYKMYLEGSLLKLPNEHEFPPNLTKLVLYRSRLNRDPIAVLEKLSNLRILSLLDNSYMGKKMVCTADGFPQLQCLNIGNLDELEEWRVEEGAMPSLEYLEIYSCGRLRMLPEGLQHTTKLKELKLDMSEEFNDKLREDWGEDWYIIRHIPFVTIK